MGIDLLIWDWNGTLLDDVSLCNNCLNQLLQENGYPQQYDHTAYKEIFDFPIIDYYRRAGFNFDRHPYSDLAARFVQIYTPRSLSCPLCPSAKSALSFAQKAGVRQIILSASEISTLRSQVQHFGLSCYFDELVGQSDFYAHGKLEAGRDWLARNNPDTTKALLIGDSLHDAEVAKTLGVGCVLCAAGHQSRERLLSAGVPVIDTLAELPALLQA